MRSSKGADSDRSADDLMTTREAARLLRYDSPKTLRKKIAAGVFREGVHFYKRRGMQYRWIRAGLYAYLRGDAVRVEDIPRLASGH
jgi:hypothetical protein